MKNTFVAAIQARNKIQLTFYSNEDHANLTRVCAPMDYAPASRGGGRGPDRFWVWDYDSDEGPHPLGLLPHQVVAIVVLADTFDPAELVKWPPDWRVPRDWGRFS